MMHVNGGRVTWSIGEGDWRIKSYKRWGQGVREGWFVGCGWGKVFFLYVGATVHESDPQLQATTAAREMGSIQGERNPRPQVITTLAETARRSIGDHQ